MDLDLILKKKGAGVNFLKMCSYLGYFIHYFVEIFFGMFCTKHT